MLVDYDNNKLFVYWSFETVDRHIIEVKKIWENWHCERQTKGVKFNFEYTNRHDKYREITTQEFNEYIRKYKFFEYK